MSVREPIITISYLSDLTLILPFFEQYQIMKSSLTYIHN